MKKIVLKNNKKPEAKIKIDDKTTISLNIDKSELQKIDRYCKENRIYRSKFIRDSVLNNLKNN